MGRIEVEDLPFDGLKLIRTEQFEDQRGDFMEVYQEAAYQAKGIACRFVQDNQVRSRGQVLRGLHFQKKFPQEKLIWVSRGKIYDVAVDLRPASETYGKWFGCVLSEENGLQLFIPRGFAHGYLTLSEETQIYYKCSEFYHPQDEGGIRWDDETLDIAWPVREGQELLLSKKDQNWPDLLTYERLRKEEEV